MKTILTITVGILLFLGTSHPAAALISVGVLSKEKAEELGIRMKSRKNGDAGVMVWLEFRKGGFLEKLSYTELRMTDAKGKHLVSARLQPRQVVHGQSEDLMTVSFSANPAQLRNCTFMIVGYRGGRGGVGYVLNVREFLDLKTVGK